MSQTEFTPRVFSGIQPSGGLTLGNYLGAIKRFVSMQEEDFETVYCMVDLHAITAKLLDPKELAHNTRELAAGFIASGISPEKSILINQSQVPEHAQLGWIFNCVARMGWMSRMTQWKDKAGKNAEAASLGLFGYPALMAADILVYHATHVPVGEDQKQHLELTRDIAAKFNHDYGVDFFPITEPVIEGAATRVMSLRDGSKKMSKSDRQEDPQGQDRPRCLAVRGRRSGRPPRGPQSGQYLCRVERTKRGSGLGRCWRTAVWHVQACIGRTGRQQTCPNFIRNGASDGRAGRN